MAETPFWLQQLLYQLPQLIVYALGVLLALVCWRRCPVPALLVVLGCLTLLGTALAYTGVQAALMQQMRNNELRADRFSQVMAVTGLLASCARAAGVLLVVLAAFVGRAPADPLPPDSSH